MAKNVETKIIRLDNVVVAHPDFIVPKSYQGGKPKFGCKVIIDRDDKKNLNLLLSEIERAKKEVFGADVPRDLVVFLRDEQIVPKNNPAFRDKYYFNAGVYAERLTPTVKDRRGNVVTDSSVFYSGCRCNIMGAVWVQNNTFGRRINFELKGAQFYQDGPRISGAAEVGDDAFEDYGDSEAAGHDYF